MSLSLSLTLKLTHRSFSLHLKLQLINSRIYTRRDRQAHSTSTSVTESFLNANARITTRLQHTWTIANFFKFCFHQSGLTSRSQKLMLTSNRFRSGRTNNFSISLYPNGREDCEDSVDHVSAYLNYEVENEETEFSRHMRFRFYLIDGKTGEKTKISGKLIFNFANFD